MHAANLPTCGPLLILFPTLKRWGPLDGRGYVATRPTCGPLLILSPALKCSGPQTICMPYRKKNDTQLMQKNLHGLTIFFVHELHFSLVHSSELCHPHGCCKPPHRCSKELDARIKQEVANLTNKEEYQFGDLTAAVDAMIKSEVEKLTGKPYEFGDLSRELDKRLLGAVCGVSEVLAAVVPALHRVAVWIQLDKIAKAWRGVNCGPVAGGGSQGTLMGQSSSDMVFTGARTVGHANRQRGPWMA